MNFDLKSDGWFIQKLIQNGISRSKKVRVKLKSSNTIIFNLFNKLNENLLSPKSPSIQISIDFQIEIKMKTRNIDFSFPG